MDELREVLHNRNRNTLEEGYANAKDKTEEVEEVAANLNELREVLQHNRNCNTAKGMQKIKNIPQNQCTFCAERFNNKHNLLKHLKKIHNILQPYQCIACDKRFSCYNCLWRHRKTYCKMISRDQDNAEEYTLPAFLVIVRLDLGSAQWIPTYGEVLQCCIVDDEIKVLNKGFLVGDIPEPLKCIFTNFLKGGTIHAKVAGAVVKNFYGEKIPVDYIFMSSKNTVNNLIAELENN